MPDAFAKSTTLRGFVQRVLTASLQQKSVDLVGGIGFGKFFGSLASVGTRLWPVPQIEEEARHPQLQTRMQ